MIMIMIMITVVSIRIPYIFPVVLLHLLSLEVLFTLIRMHHMYPYHHHYYCITF